MLYKTSYLKPKDKEEKETDAFGQQLWPAIVEWICYTTNIKTSLLWRIIYLINLINLFIYLILHIIYAFTVCHISVWYHFQIAPYWDTWSWSKRSAILPHPCTKVILLPLSSTYNAFEFLQLLRQALKAYINVWVAQIRYLS